MNQTHRLERPGAHESAVTGNHVYEKTSHRDSDDPAVGGAGKFAGLAAPALAKRGAKIRGLAPNAKQGDIVRKHGAAEIAIADLRDRASLDAALEDGDAVCDIEPAVLRRRAVLPLMKGRGWGRIVGEYGITVNVLAPGLTVTPSTKKIFPSELLEGQRRGRTDPT